MCVLHLPILRELFSISQIKLWYCPWNRNLGAERRNMKQILTRELYKKIKQMDRQEMQLFLENLYQEGRDSVPGIDVNRIKEIVMEVKGVGEKKASLIEQKIREAFQEGEEKWD